MPYLHHNNPGKFLRMCAAHRHLAYSFQLRAPINARFHQIGGVFTIKAAVPPRHDLQARLPPQGHLNVHRSKLTLSSVIHEAVPSMRCPRNRLEDSGFMNLMNELADTMRLRGVMRPKDKTRFRVLHRALKHRLHSLRYSTVSSPLISPH